jgi:hypothetical protein
MNVTLTNGVDSVDIPLLDTGGTPLFVATFGKPHQSVKGRGGTLDPRVFDRESGLVNYNLIGRLFDYDDAITLADLIKSFNPQNPLRLQNPLPEHPDETLVVPAAGNDSALTLEYPFGYKDYVNVQLVLTRVDEVRGTGQVLSDTPTSSGQGPVQIVTENRRLDISENLSVVHTVGRPNDVTRKTPVSQDPKVTMKRKVTHDAFEIAFELTDDGVSFMSKFTNDVFRQQYGRRGIGLDFNGVFGLGAFPVAPVGTQPLREIRSAGEQEVIVVPSLDLRVIYANNAVV